MVAWRTHSHLSLGLWKRYEPFVQERLQAPREIVGVELGMSPEI